MALLIFEKSLGGTGKGGRGNGESERGEVRKKMPAGLLKRRDESPPRGSFSLSFGLSRPLLADVVVIVTSTTQFFRSSRSISLAGRASFSSNVYTPPTRHIGRYIGG